MIRSVAADELLRSARRAAGTANVREAVRNLTLHALRSRFLTTEHIASVARTVGEGIESSDVLPTAPVRETHRGAWAGLEDAVGQALHAIELAARQLAEGRACLPMADRERMLAEIAQMERSFGEKWEFPRAVPASLRARIASVATLLEQAAAIGPSAPADSGPEAGAILSFVASGVLLGLSEDLREPPEGAAR
ncbi:MAG: hypothetical protein IPP91_00890 [Betaproteobacteria bacterium]|nr:hypothetical protein [Betaproteobacteria bacterium]